MGFLGLSVAIGYSAFTLGLWSIATHFEYWTRVVLAVIARRLAKQGFVKPTASEILNGE
jgi:hypothetical protein